MQLSSILLADNEIDARAALGTALNENGNNVVSVSNGFDALAKFKSEKFDIVIMDMELPQLSGIETLREIRKISTDVPVIMTAAGASVSDAVEVMKNGASDYMIKPVAFELIHSIIKKFEPNTSSLNIRMDNGSSHRSSITKKIITQDPKLTRILQLAESVAPSEATVLILGESGTGKELLSSYIHYKSGRNNGPFVAVNCAALPETLAESELFGHEKGAFTGAINRKVGKFELANNGTILLDEISEMPLPLQAKLLRVIQEREVDRIGGTRPVPINTRVIAVSNKDLKTAVKEGKFREDLFYRINVIPLTIPPLRERPLDIEPLAYYFLKKYCSLNNKKITQIHESTMSRLLSNEWKGNVREFENTIERAVLLGGRDILMPEHLFLDDTSECSTKNPIPIRVGLSVREMEQELITRTLEELNGNRTHAAQMLGISIRTLRNKLCEYRVNHLFDDTAEAALGTI